MMRTERTNEDTLQEALVKSVYFVISALVAAGACQVIGAVLRLMNLSMVDINIKTVVLIGVLIVLVDCIINEVREMKAEMKERDSDYAVQ